jgi:hypothetical protein
MQVGTKWDCVKLVTQIHVVFIGSQVNLYVSTITILIVTACAL